MNQEHEHIWRVQEDDYTRTWATEVTENPDGSLSITATYSGPSDWSDSGSGEYLHCIFCGERRDLTPADTIDWQ